MKEFFEKVIDYIIKNPAVFIAGLSFLLSFCAFVTNTINQVKSDKRYINSLNPQLSFSLFEKNDYLVLRIKNTGKSAAKNIKLNFKKLLNNGEQNICISKAFIEDIELYPEEEIEGAIALSGKSISECIAPILKLNIKYTKTNNNKTIQYDRTISFKDSFIEKNEHIPTIANSVKSMKYSLNRVANYVEGRWFASFDEIDAAPNSSLYNDVYNAIHDDCKREKECGRSKSTGDLVE